MELLFSPITAIAQAMDVTLKHIFAPSRSQLGTLNQNSLDSISKMWPKTSKNFVKITAKSSEQENAIIISADRVFRFNYCVSMHSTQLSIYRTHKQLFFQSSRELAAKSLGVCVDDCALKHTCCHAITTYKAWLRKISHGISAQEAYFTLLSSTWKRMLGK